MIAVGLLFVRMLCDYFKPRQQLEAEILVLRHQLWIPCDCMSGCLGSGSRQRFGAN